jgi:hypothetical protein
MNKYQTQLIIDLLSSYKKKMLKAYNKHRTENVAGIATMYKNEYLKATAIQNQLINSDNQ